MMLVACGGWLETGEFLFHGDLTKRGCEIHYTHVRRCIYGDVWAGVNGHRCFSASV